MDNKQKNVLQKGSYAAKEAFKELTNVESCKEQILKQGNSYFKVVVLKSL